MKSNEIKQNTQLSIFFDEDFIADKEELSNPSLDFLLNNQSISVKVYHLLKNNGLLNLEDILSYYKQKKRSSADPISELIGWGKKNSVEFISFCENQISLQREQFGIDKNEYSDSTILIINHLTDLQKDILQCFIYSNINNKNPRVKLFYSKLQNNYSIDNYYVVMSLESSIIIHEKSIRKQHIQIINEVHNSIIYYFEKIRTTIDTSILIEEYIVWKLAPNYSLTQNERDLLKSFIKKNASIPFFQLIQIIIDGNKLFENQTKNHIFKNSMNYFTNENIKSLEEIGIETDKTTERVRQIRLDIFNGLNSKFELLRDFIPYLYKYNLDLNSNLMDINFQFVDGICKNESVFFNSNFIKKAFSIIYSDTYILFGNEEDVIFRILFQRKDSHIWKSTYLLKREILEKIDLYGLIEAVATKCKDELNVTEYFDFETYLSPYLLISSVDMPSIIRLTKTILLNETDIRFDDKNQIVFERNTRKNISDYVIEILENENKPMHIDKIFGLLDAKHPGLTKNTASLRGSIYLIGDRLFCIGRTSTYGLKKWESEGNNIKGGTIREIVEEYLDNFSEPQSIESIELYVKNFRPNTDAESIYNNIKLEVNNRFQFFESKYVGIKSKVYSDKFQLIDITIKTIRSWEESWAELELFVKTYKRLPKNSTSDDESRLYRFLYLQKKRLNHKILRIPDLTEVQRHLITSLLLSQRNDYLDFDDGLNDQLF